MRRELWETLVDILESLSVPDAAEHGLRITSVMLDLPIELQAQPTPTGFQLRVDLPQSSWSAGIDEPPGRMKLLVLREEQPSREEQPLRGEQPSQGEQP